jgi:amino acid adenylation domain-containing protein
MSLYAPVRRHAQTHPTTLAVAGPDATLTYAELDRLAAKYATALLDRGVRKGDRVILHLPKSARAVAMLQAVLRVGAVYVPLDPLSPDDRVRRIVHDCRPALVVDDLAAIPDAPPQPEPIAVDPHDPAYILYTSGSTGEPKGVCLSHRNAEAFIAWVVDTIQPTPADRFANHAPFHFDLSVLDLYAAFHVGASVHLIPETSSFAAADLNRFLHDNRITVWYSVPSVLQMMLADLSFPTKPALRVLFFAGENFPIRPLRLLRNAWPAVRFWNLYGPTETNVCTAYEVRDIPADRDQPVPIGSACSGDRVWARTTEGSFAKPGEEGELIVEGPTVMLGYWGAPPQGSTYATGDWVRRLDDSDYQFLGRIDNMVKHRGYRIELGAIEAVLTLDPRIEQAAVVVEGEGLDAKLVAYVAGPNCPRLIEIKRLCAERLPRYMIVDRVRAMSALPLNPNGKVDRRRLMAGAVHG